MTLLTGPIVNPANGHTYFLLDPMSWALAEADALALGGHLSTINDAAENNWVFATFAPIASTAGLWVGLNDVGQEGSFAWASGVPVTFSNWGWGEPNNAQQDPSDVVGEDYAGIWTTPGYNVEGELGAVWNDFPEYSAHNAVVEVAPQFRSGTEGDDLMTGGADADQMRGGDGDDTLNGNRGDDTLLGDVGDDDITGDRGNDWLAGSDGDDNLEGGRGSDTMNGENGDDNLEGGRENDVLVGGDGDDDLYGGDGDDTLVDGHGWDYLVGGQGGDRFFLQVGDSELDLVSDFSGASGQFDTIALIDLPPGSEITFESGILIVDGEWVAQIVGDFNLSMDLA